MKIQYELSKLGSWKRKGCRIISVVPLQFKQIQSGDYEASSLLNDVQVKIISIGAIRDINVSDEKKNKRILIKISDGTNLEIVTTVKEFEKLKSQLFYKSTRKNLTLIKKRK